MARNYQPNWASPPGKTISDIIQSKGITLVDLADSLDESVAGLKNVLTGKREIDHSLATRLESVIGGSSQFWISREEKYRMRLNELNRSAPDFWLKIIPYKELAKLGWIRGKGDWLSECLEFFGVSNINEWWDVYDKRIQMSKFRKSNAFTSKFGSVVSWLRQGEKQIEANTTPWNRVLLENSIDEMRKLSRLKSPKDFIPKLKTLCGNSGVQLVIVKTPSGCPVSGVTYFGSDGKPIIQLSFRYMSDDHFWFTFFHEVGHLILHSEDEIYFELSNSSIEGEMEIEANLFAQEAIIPVEFQEELYNLKRNKRNIIGFALKAGVSPGVVVGQMQFRKIIKHEYMNAYKRRYEWADIFE